MKKEHKEFIQQTIEIIDTHIKKSTSTGSIKYHIHEMLLESNLGISDIDHYDKYYFKVVMGKRLASYIREQRLNYACAQYPNEKKQLTRRSSYYNVSQFIHKYENKQRGVTMKKYMVTDMWRLEYDDLMHESYNEGNKEFLIVEAATKEEAISKYLAAEMEFVAENIIKETIFKTLWDSTAHGELDFLDELENKEAVFELTQRICRDYLEGESLEPEKLYLDNDVDELTEEYWQLLTPNERTSTYIMALYNDFACLELISLAQFKKMNRSLLPDAGPKDIKLLKVIATMIQRENREEYPITATSFLECGHTQEETEELLLHLLSDGLKNILHYKTDTGIDYKVALLNVLLINNNDNVTITVKPHPLLIKLAEGGYDFEQSNKKIAKQIIECHLTEKILIS